MIVQRYYLRFMLAVLVALLSACAADGPYQVPVDAPRTHTLYVVNYAWHTGLVIARDDLPADRIPEQADFPEAAYFEFG